MSKLLFSITVICCLFGTYGCSSGSTSDGVKPMVGHDATPDEQAAAKAKLDSMPKTAKPGMDEPRKDGS